MYIKDFYEFRIWLGSGNKEAFDLLSRGFKAAGYNIQHDATDNCKYIKIHKDGKIRLDRSSYKTFKNYSEESDYHGLDLSGIGEKCNLVVDSMFHTLELNKKRLKVGCQDITIEDARKIKKFLNDNLD